MSTAIVITSGKGGTGKTSITGGVASCLAALGHRVLCIDMDIGLRNLDLTLGLSDRALMDFTDVLCGRCTLERAAVPHPVIQGLFLLTAPVTLPEAPLSEAAMKELIHRAREGYDYILMDSPAGLGEGFRLACCAADRAVVVSTTDEANVHCITTNLDEARFRCSGTASPASIWWSTGYSPGCSAAFTPPLTTPWTPPACPCWALCRRIPR